MKNEIIRIVVESAIQPSLLADMIECDLCDKQNMVEEIKKIEYTTQYDSLITKSKIYKIDITNISKGHYTSILRILNMLTDKYPNLIQVYWVGVVDKGD